MKESTDDLIEFLRVRRSLGHPAEICVRLWGGDESDPEAPAVMLFEAGGNNVLGSGASLREATKQAADTLYQVAIARMKALADAVGAEVIE